MKKIMVLILSVIALGSFFCGCQKDKNSAMNSDEAEKLSEIHAQYLLDGEYENIIDASSEKVKKAITVDALKQTWEQTIKSCGEYKGVYSTDIEENSGTYTVKKILEFENQGILLTFSYNNSSEISGLYMNLNTIVKTDDLDKDEQLISVGEYGLKGIAKIVDKSAPVVILVQGSGSSDFNETIGANKPFKEIADYLGENGVNTIRYNKRYYEKPDLSANEEVTIYTEYLDDVYWIIDYAKENLDGDIYVLGHSLGGMSVAKIANDNPSVKGIISMAGTYRGLEDLILEQNELSLEKMDKSEEEKQEIISQVEAEVQKVKGLDGAKDEAILGTPSTYWESLKDLKCEEYSKKLEIPMLILQGESDFQVTYENDFLPWKEMLKNKQNVTFKSYKGLTHLFMPSIYNGEFDMREYEEENHISKDVLKDIVEFINTNK